MTTYLGKSCSFCLPRVPFVNCRQFMYLVISLFWFWGQDMGSDCISSWSLLIFLLSTKSQLGIKTFLLNSTHNKNYIIRCTVYIGPDILCIGYKCVWMAWVANAAWHYMTLSDMIWHDMTWHDITLLDLTLWLPYCSGSVVMYSCVNITLVLMGKTLKKQVF